MGEDKHDPQQGQSGWRSRPGMLVGSGGPDRKPRKAIKIAILVVLIGALLASGVFAYRMSRTSDVDSSESSKSAEQADTPKKKLEEQVDLLDSEGKYDEKADAIEAYLETDPPVADKAMQTQQLAAASLNAGDYDKAISAFQEAAKLNATFKIGSLQGEAQAHEAKGDIAKAIETRKKVIEAMKEQGADKNRSSIMIEEQIVTSLERMR